MSSRDQVRRWVDEYERAWREADLDAIETMFTPDAEYRPSPYAPSIVGHDAIREFWVEDEDGETFTMTSEVVAVDGETAVVRVEVHYGDPVTQEYRDLWLIRFAADGRAEDFEEWAYWPDRGYSARGE